MQLYCQNEETHQCHYIINDRHNAVLLSNTYVSLSKQDMHTIYYVYYWSLEIKAELLDVFDLIIISLLPKPS